MMATATPVSSPRPQMPWPTYATPQTTSANNTSERTSVPTISRCFQTGFQRFLLAACTSCSSSAVGGSVVTDELRFLTLTLLSDKPDRSLRLFGCTDLWVP